MKTKLYFSILLGVITILSSCSNYGYISENDVYMQAPTEVDLDENENDLTSFNAFKARERGIFKDEYRDPRINERIRMNQFMISSAYMPFGLPHGMYSNRPFRFHGMGLNWYGSLFTVGHHGIYNGFYNHYGFGTNPYGYYPYGYGHGYTYGYNPYYYGGGYYNGIDNHSDYSVANQPVHYVKRTPLTSSSNRSSSYQMTYFKQPVEVPASGYDVNDHTLGTSRRAVQQKYAGSNNFQNNGKPNNGNYTDNVNSYSSSVHQQAARQYYTPNASARRSGAVQTQRNVIDGHSSRGVNSSLHRSSPTQARPQPQVRGSFSTGVSVRGTSRNMASPSSRGSSGTSNSSSGRR